MQNTRDKKLRPHPSDEKFFRKLFYLLAIQYLKDPKKGIHFNKLDLKNTPLLEIHEKDIIIPKIDPKTIDEKLRLHCFLDIGDNYQCYFVHKIFAEYLIAELAFAELNLLSNRESQKLEYFSGNYFTFESLEFFFKMIEKSNEKYDKLTLSNFISFLQYPVEEMISTYLVVYLCNYFEFYRKKNKDGLIYQNKRANIIKFIKEGINKQTYVYLNSNYGVYSQQHFYNILKSPNDFGLLLENSSLKSLKLFNIFNVEIFSHNIELPALEYLEITGNIILSDLNCLNWMIPKLKQLSIQTCHSLLMALGNTSSFPNLENLSIGNCEKFKILSQKIEELKNLKILSIHNCVNLLTIPNNIGKIASLEHLDIMGSDELVDLPESIGNLINLSSLSLQNLPKLGSLGNILSTLPKLNTLYLQGNKSLKSIGYEINPNIQIEELNLSRCYALEKLPQNLGDLKKIFRIDLCDCHSLKILPDSLTDLTELNTILLVDTKNLEQLPKNFDKLAKLMLLVIHNCPKLTNFPQDFSFPPNITYLEIDTNKLIQEQLSKNSWKKLVHLKLSPHKYSYSDFFEYSFTRKVIWKTIEQRYESLEIVPPWIFQVKTLKKLELHWNYNLKEISNDISLVSKLETLNLAYCKNLESLPDSICDLYELKELDLKYCENLLNLPKNFKKLQNIENISLSHCYKLKRLPKSIGLLPNLKKVSISYCKSLKSIPKSLIDKLHEINVIRYGLDEHLFR